MNFVELVAGVLGGLFVAGIVIGVLLVAVFPRSGRRRVRGYAAGADWREPPAPPEDDGKPSRWPGG
jgi:hypothetical protein